MRMPETPFSGQKGRKGSGPSSTRSHSCLMVTRNAATTQPVEERIRHTAGKQEDPTEKRGIIGAFCRAHTITDVLDTLLKDVYLDIWHWPKTDAPYVCIEPWRSLPARRGEIAVLEEQENLVCLECGKCYTNRWQIAIHEI